MYIISISHTGKITHLDRSTLTPAALSMGLCHNDESSMTKIGINKKNKTKRENTPHIFRKFCAVNKINNIDVNQTIITIGNMSHQYTNWAMYRLFFFFVLLCLCTAFHWRNHSNIIYFSCSYLFANSKERRCIGGLWVRETEFLQITNRQNIYTDACLHFIALRTNCLFIFSHFYHFGLPSSVLFFSMPLCTSSCPTPKLPIHIEYSNIYA